jgi:hypothetical protein
LNLERDFFIVGPGKNDFTRQVRTGKAGDPIALEISGAR